jgi:uncharacterized protein YjbI with pentapeptide repeats
MANAKHLAILKQGVEVWNRWRQEQRKSYGEERLDLRGAELRSADLVKVNFGRSYITSRHGGMHFAYVDLRGADLSEALLMGANFLEADLSEARLTRADLAGAILKEANLFSADLNGASLNNASFWHGDLRGSDWNGVLLGETVFADVDLSGVRNLATCLHLGPSIVDHRTLIGSGTLPLPFLRGCGLPDSLIEHLPSLVQRAIQYQSCFISHSTLDREFADRVYADLQSKGVRCWFAPHDVKGGKKLHEQIDEAIRVYDRLLLILSEHSMSSEWVKTEIANARQREGREKRQMLFPITLVPHEKVKEWRALDADTGKDSAREIREYFIPDFSNWKDHDSYQQAFQRLLRDLKADGGATAEVELL